VDDEVSVKKVEMLKNYFEVISDCELRARPLELKLGIHHREYVEQENQRVAKRDAKQRKLMQETLHCLRRCDRLDPAMPKPRRNRSCPKVLKCRLKDKVLTDCSDASHLSEFSIASSVQPLPKQVVLDKTAALKLNFKKGIQKRLTNWKANLLS